MQVKVRKQNKDGLVRLESGGSVKEILIKENLMRPEGELIAICFRGIDSSGIVELSPQELEKVWRTVSRKMHLVKGYEEFFEPRDSGV